MFIDQVCCCLQQLSCRIKPIVLGTQRVPEAALETALKVRCQDWPLRWEGVRKKSHNLDHNYKTVTKQSQSQSAAHSGVNPIRTQQNKPDLREKDAQVCAQVSRDGQRSATSPGKEPRGS